MARSTERSLRKESGGRYHQARTKKKYELAGFPANTKLGKETRMVNKRGMGGSIKHYLLSANKVNVTKKDGKTQVSDIINVIENPANPHLVRRNVITKGAIVETKLGKVRITSRPGQEGGINGVIV